MRFTQDFIDKVRDANNVVEIIGQYTELKRAGARLMARCPFPDHVEKTPSFSVTEDNQLYFCYGCKKGGNVFTFLETYNGMSFPEAVEFLAKRAGLPMPVADEARRGAGPGRDQKDQLLKVNRSAAVFYHHCLKAQPEDSVVRQYLIKRGLSDETVETFRLGFAPDDWQALTRNFAGRQVPFELAETVGLVKPKKGAPKGDRDRAESYFDLFRNRLMFPIFSPTGDVVGFGGRTLGDDLAKYVNSSESPVFHKGRILYGLHETGKFIRAQDEAIVVEGYMDAIALYTAGIKNVVAILGTAFTPEHAKLLKRYTLNVKMLLDGDEAGILGAERSLPILLEAGLMAKGYVLPEKMDPDDFVKAHGPDQLRTEIGRAPELFTLLLTRRWLKDYKGSPSDKVRVVEEAASALRPAIIQRQSPQLIDLYLLEIAQQLDVEIGWARRAVMQSVQTEQSRQAKMAPKTLPEAPLASVSPNIPGALSPSDDKVSVKGAPRDEAFILSLLVHNESLMRELQEAGPEEILGILSHEGVRHLLARALEKYRQRPESFDSLAASLASQIDQPSIITCSLELVGGGATNPDRLLDPRKLMGDYLNAIRKRFLQSQAKALATQIKNQATPETLEQFMNIQRDRLSLNRD